MIFFALIHHAVEESLIILVQVICLLVTICFALIFFWTSEIMTHDQECFSRLDKLINQPLNLSIFFI